MTKAVRTQAGDNDKALSYTDEAAGRLLGRFDARVQIALMRGRVLLARGDADVAAAALEHAVCHRRRPPPC